MEHNFSDFTIANYRRLLSLAKKDYKFIPYRPAKHIKEGSIILRHDVDFSPQRALRLATLEKKMGVISTYCIQLGSSFYNVFEDNIRRIFKKISSMGHSLGLHFYPRSYRNAGLDGIDDGIAFEKGVLSDMLRVDLSVVSFHNPNVTKELLSRKRIAGLLNAYSQAYMKNMKYVSDSNGYWRYERLEDVVLSGEHKKLHILIHPGWWQEGAAPPWLRIQRCTCGRKEFTDTLYKEILRKGKRENVSC